jgi:hypothetical protein
MWTWHWWLFIVAIIPCAFFVAVARGAANESNIEKFGSSADYRVAFQTEPTAILGGTFVAGVICAAIIAGLAGLIQTETVPGGASLASILRDASLTRGSSG